MRALAPLLAFAFSCVGANAASQSNANAASQSHANAASQRSTPSAPPPSPAAVQDAGPGLDAGLDAAAAAAQQALDAPGSPAGVVCSALAVLAKTRGAAAVPAIAAKLASPDVTVRSAAVEALGEIGGPQARAALQKRLDAESRPEVRAAIERAMAKASP